MVDCNNCTTPKAGGGEEGTKDILALLFLPGFVLGFISAVILLIAIPKLYIKLRCQRCSRSHDSILRKKEHPNVETECTDIRRSNQYSEIDEKKTRTFANPKQALPRAKAVVNAETTNRLRYEQCIVGNNTHIYSDIEGEASAKNKEQNESTTNSYEPFSPGKQNSKQVERVSNHDYYILEPGSDKRLPVKPFESKSETLPFDPGHVYFKLEPGTSKVTPVFQNTIKNESSRSSGSDPGHIYFILEPMAESADTETLAYAVNDVATSPSFFILEKSERSA